MMEFGEREEIRLLSDGPVPSSSSTLCQCRICHEEEEERSTNMESPCSCSGTLKFAHRGCIQRWCDEKGSTVCEICLQKFEPGYTVPPKITQLIDVVVTIRSSLEVPRLNYEPQAAFDDGLDQELTECSPANGRGASYCRFITLMVTIMLLIRHLLAVLTIGADHYAFTLTTVFMLRACGILLPFYVVMRLISAIQHGEWQQMRRWRQLHASSEERDGSMIYGDEEEDIELQQRSVRIRS